MPDTLLGTFPSLAFRAMSSYDAPPLYPLHWVLFFLSSLKVRNLFCPTLYPFAFNFPSKVSNSYTQKLTLPKIQILHFQKATGCLHLNFVPAPQTSSQICSVLTCLQSRSLERTTHTLDTKPARGLLPFAKVTTKLLASWALKPGSPLSHCSAPFSPPHHPSNSTGTGRWTELGRDCLPCALTWRRHDQPSVHKKMSWWKNKSDLERKRSKNMLA